MSKTETGSKTGSAPKKRLGLGLDALLGDAPIAASPAEVKDGITVLPIELIVPDNAQPRRHFDQTDIEELAQSITAQGLIQPILVRPLSGREGHYQITAGERRWRAAQIAKLHEIPVVIRNLSDAESAQIALIENIQRVDLSPIEEAHGYKRLIDEHDYTQAHLAGIIGKSRSHIANILRLIQLSDDIQQALVKGELTMGHGRALLAAKNADALARRIIKDGLSVRETERLIRESQDGRSRSGRRQSNNLTQERKSDASTRNADITSLQRDLTDALGVEVTINHYGKKGGKVEISYRTIEELDFICARLSGTIF